MAGSAQKSAAWYRAERRAPPFPGHLAASAPLVASLAASCLGRLIHLLHPWAWVCVPTTKCPTAGDDCILTQCMPLSRVWCVCVCVCVRACVCVCVCQGIHSNLLQLRGSTILRSYHCCKP